MEKKRAHPTTIRLTEQDRMLLARVRELYGCNSDMAAIRLALRIAARQEKGPPEGGAAIHQEL
jgi:hypothetical protein